MIRDQALAASGLLVDKLGGPPVKPYQPAGVWEEATFGNSEYEQDQGDALYRRSLYTFWRRIVGPTKFFDAATRQTCTVKPTRTNTPLHALTTLNDSTSSKPPTRWPIARADHAGPAPSRRVELAFRLVLARRPTPRNDRCWSRPWPAVRRDFAADLPRPEIPQGANRAKDIADGGGTTPLRGGRRGDPEPGSRRGRSRRSDSGRPPTLSWSDR